MASTMWTLIAVEAGSLFAVASAAAVWARHGFRLPKRRDGAQ